MNSNELQKVLDSHQRWLNGDEGERIYLRGVDLRYANLQGADLQGADLQGANLRHADLRGADLRGADLRGACLRDANLADTKLQYADLRHADLRRADLRDANLDFSCWPLWCGSRNVRVDRRIAQQLAAHFCALDCDDEDYIKARDAILKFAEGSHVSEYLL